MDNHYIRVALDVPLTEYFTYTHHEAIPSGLRVLVSFGHRKMIGVVVDHSAEQVATSYQLKPIELVYEDVPALSADYMYFAQQAAAYYHRPLGEVLLPAFPSLLRKPSAYERKKISSPVARLLNKKKKVPLDTSYPFASVEPTLTPEQQTAVDHITSIQDFKPVLLHGVTGSGKTEVYLRAACHILSQGKQVLILVPEINLTPQLEHVLKQRLEVVSGVGTVQTLHSGLAETARLDVWYRSLLGETKVVIGTRLAIMTPMNDLGLIIVDEEHDTSYKQQDGLRYSARDLAVWRAQQLNIPVILGSATPSLETWLNAKKGKYQRCTLTTRAKTVAMPTLELLDTRRAPLDNGLTQQVMTEIERRLANKEQVLIFLNRRGYAPVISCEACGWIAHCQRCSAYMVLHQGKRGHYLQCHHCGGQHRINHHCPDCGNQDLHPMGRGTQRLEEFLTERFPEAKVLRIDADSTRLKGSAERLFNQVHDGDVDILVGTQMVSKGHDFKNLNYVAVLNSDNLLFSHDFRAPERLFAQLMQVMGRAGRTQAGAKVSIQTNYPEHDVYQALLTQDYPRFADYSLEERESAGLPPYTFQALLTAESKALATALEFLKDARQAGMDMIATQSEDWHGLTIYDPVPLRIVRVANIERAQLLIECSGRKTMHYFLGIWQNSLTQLKSAKSVRWVLEVDPLEI